MRRWDFDPWHQELLFIIRETERCSPCQAQLLVPFRGTPCVPSGQRHRLSPVSSASGSGLIRAAWRGLIKSLAAAAVADLPVWIAGATDLASLVVMSKGTKYTQQSYKVADTFPFEWIKKKWNEGFNITSLATGGGEKAPQWAVVMSRTTGFNGQCIELDFQYPSEGIHRRWDAGQQPLLTARSETLRVPLEFDSVTRKQSCSVCEIHANLADGCPGCPPVFSWTGEAFLSGPQSQPAAYVRSLSAAVLHAGYRITACAATPYQAALVLSIPRRNPQDETQETLRTSMFPSTHVKVPAPPPVSLVLSSVERPYRHICQHQSEILCDRVLCCKVVVVRKVEAV